MFLNPLKIYQIFSNFSTSTQPKTILTLLQNFVMKEILPKWSIKEKLFHKIKPWTWWLKSLMVIIKLLKMELSIEILNLLIFSFPIIKLKSLTLVLLWKMSILKNILLIMLEAQFICRLKHSMTINTALKVIFGLLVLYTTKCLLEKLHGEPKHKNNLESSFFQCLLKDFFLKIFLKRQLTF